MSEGKLIVCCILFLVLLTLLAKIAADLIG